MLFIFEISISHLYYSCTRNSILNQSTFQGIKLYISVSSIKLCVNHFYRLNEISNNNKFIISTIQMKMLVMQPKNSCEGFCCRPHAAMWPQSAERRSGLGPSVPAEAVHPAAGRRSVEWGATSLFIPSHSLRQLLGIWFEM